LNREKLDVNPLEMEEYWLDTGKNSKNSLITHAGTQSLPWNLSLI